MNRKQRRAQQPASSGTSIDTADQIPMRIPERERKPINNNSGSKVKTLYEIAAEKQAELLPQAQRLNAARFPSQPDASNLVTVKVGPDGTIVHDDDTGRPFRVEDITRGSQDDQTAAAAALPPWIDTLMLATSLGGVHFTLEVLTVHQYAEELHLAAIARHAGLVAVPTLCLLLHLFHGHVFGVPWLGPRAKYMVQQVFFVGVANAAGCYLIQLTNEHAYYAVMKNAPSVGTLWVWSVIELGLAGALAGVIGPGLYAWWYGYGIY